MALRSFSIEEKLAAVCEEIDRARVARRDPGSTAHHHYLVLKSVAADLRARIDPTRCEALGEFERAITRMIRSKTALGYGIGQKMAVADVLINRWPLVSQALEQFGRDET